jgi:hypothetical protein
MYKQMQLHQSSDFEWTRKSFDSLPNIEVDKNNSRGDFVVK